MQRRIKERTFLYAYKVYKAYVSQKKINYQDNVNFLIIDSKI